MTKLTGQQIRTRAKELLDQSPGGLRWSEILRLIGGETPDTPANTIHGQVHKFLKEDRDVVKIAKGTYALSKYVQPGLDELLADKPDVESTVANEGQPSIREHDFYELFANWLKDELDEVNEALVLGGNIFKSKWGTPDVIGTLKALKADYIKFQTQIVSAEIKIDSGQSIVAFGQAVAYRLFSHKSYVVVPNSTPKDDISRLEALAMISGIGLVTFDLNTTTPDFNLRVRAQISQPDMFYVNQIAKRVHEHSPDVFERLF